MEENQMENFNCETSLTQFMLSIYSADPNGNGLLETSMKTNVEVSSDGTCSWYCPIIFKSECTTDIKWSPFDRQSCPLKFGLGTFDGRKVNSRNFRDTADLANYNPSGEYSNVK